MAGPEGHRHWRRGLGLSWRSALRPIPAIIALALPWSCAAHPTEPITSPPEASPLHEAVRRHDLDAATVLLQAGADVDSLLSSGYGVPPLAIATRLGDEEMVRLLLSYGANVNAQDTVGNTPLHAAAGSLAAPPLMTALLLSAGADPNIRGRKGATALWYASLAGRPEVARLLVDHGADVDVQEYFAYMSPLDSAASLGHIRVVELLLEAGADVDITSPAGTPLHSAAYSQHTDIAALLLRYGAEVNAVDAHDVTPLHLAAATGDGADERTERTATADLLITHGARLNAMQCDRMTPLDAAVYVDDTEMTDFLLRHGARSGHELVASTQAPPIPLGDSTCW